MSAECHETVTIPPSASNTDLLRALFINTAGTVFAIEMAWVPASEVQPYLKGMADAYLDILTERFGLSYADEIVERALDAKKITEARCKG